MNLISVDSSGKGFESPSFVFQVEDFQVGRESKRKIGYGLKSSYSV